MSWPLLALAKLGRDAAQLWGERRAGARFPIGVALLLLYGATVFLGGLGALLQLPPASRVLNQSRGGRASIGRSR